MSEIGIVPFWQVLIICATCMVYRYYTCARVSAIDTLVLVKVLFGIIVGENVKNGRLRLQQTQFAGAGYGFSASLNL